jgi:hypothetical protein
MPANINHYWDDIMFGESFRQKVSGTFIDWRPCWSHRHDVDAITSTRIHRTQLMALEAKPIPIQPAKQQVTLSICLIVRNEARYIGEWIEFHRLVGVERFFIYDDESSDATIDIIRAHDRGDIVVNQGGRKGNASPQISAYRHFVEHFRNETRWVAFIDADEYLFSPTGADLRGIIVRYEETPYHGAVFVNWLFFGDNGHSTRPTGLTIESYTRRGFAGVPNCRGKPIARTSLLGGFGPCGPHNVLCRDNGLTVNEHESWVAGCDSTPASIDLLRLKVLAAGASPSAVHALGTWNWRGRFLAGMGTILPASPDHRLGRRSKRPAARQPSDYDRDRRSQRPVLRGRFRKVCAL